MQGIPDSGIIAGINVPVFENRNSRNIIPDSGFRIRNTLPRSSPILVLDPAAGAKAAVDPHMYWLHVGPSMEPSTGGTGTSAVVNMESIPMGIFIVIHRDCRARV